MCVGPRGSASHDVSLVIHLESEQGGQLFIAPADRGVRERDARSTHTCLRALLCISLPSCFPAHSLSRTRELDDGEDGGLAHACLGQLSTACFLRIDGPSGLLEHICLWQ
ncbi:hypothetical protein CBOM_07977 [Ceraceosorus bombacis]|uniref:Uncharacterized protein n=1 Tax=Ceraceosorus bombacis TaxID=401625 RepID=A0A0P1BR87_9BASI|nr:hypothetical protein CBOM_07977 [Ceraceosorus bombacis]